MNFSFKPGVVSNSLPLARSDNPTGQIHSLFNSSFNIVFGRDLVNVASATMQCSSFGLNLSEEAVTHLIKSLIVGDRVVQKDSRLVLYSSCGGVIEINLAKLKVLDLKLKRIEPTVERVEAVIRALESVAWLDDIGLPIDERTVGVLRSLCAADLAKETLQEVFEFLIGRGKGLTPSGDDVLLGYLMVRKLFGNTPRSEQWRVKEIEQKTTLISVNYLRLLSMGYVSEYFQNFCQAATIPDDASLKQSVERIKRVGATSGSDMLLGMSLGIDKIGGTIVEFLQRVI